MKETAKVTRFILITATIMVLLLPYSYQTSMHVGTCPSNEQTWAKRSRSFRCNDSREVYHCLQNSNYTLIETCLKVHNVPSFKAGCPWVKVYKGKHMLGHPYNPCDPTHTGCPSTFHEVYKTNELYRYPACIQSTDATTSHKTESVTKITSAINGEVDNGASRTSTLLTYLGIILGCLCFMAFVFSVLFFALRKKVGQYCKAGLDDHQENYSPVSTNEKNQIISTFNTGEDIRIQESDPCDRTTGRV